jgi:hypothetical protein
MEVDKYINFKRNKRKLSVEERLWIENQRLLWSEERLTALQKNRESRLSAQYNKFQKHNKRDISRKKFGNTPITDLKILKKENQKINQEHRYEIDDSIKEKGIE